MGDVARTLESGLGTRAPYEFEIPAQLSAVQPNLPAAYADILGFSHRLISYRYWTSIQSIRTCYATSSPMPMQKTHTKKPKLAAHVGVEVGPCCWCWIWILRVRLQTAAVLLLVLSSR